MNKLRVFVADDERPARELLKSILREFDNIEIVGEAENGSDAVQGIRLIKPDLALLDLKMPEMSGLEAVRMLRKDEMPMIAFVTAYDEFAVQAFEVNAVDYLLKPIEKKRLAQTLVRASEKIETADWRNEESESISRAAADYQRPDMLGTLEWVPVKLREEIYLIPIGDVSSIVADGELLRISTVSGKRYVINHRLKDLESRLDERKFVRLSRGAIVNLSLIDRISPMPGGSYIVTLKSGEEVRTSRSQSKIIRSRLLNI